MMEQERPAKVYYDIFRDFCDCTDGNIGLSLRLTQDYFFTVLRAAQPQKGEPSTSSMKAILDIEFEKMAKGKG